MSKEEDERFGVLSLHHHAAARSLEFWPSPTLCYYLRFFIRIGTDDVSTLHTDS
jgi:hypothetical protein